MTERGFLGSACDPHAGCVFDGDTRRWFTREELQNDVAAFTEKLTFSHKALGFLFALNDVDSLVAYLAAVEAGHAIVMLNPELDCRLKSNLIERFQPDFIIAPATHAPETNPDYSTQSDGSQILLRARKPHRHTIHPHLTLLISTSGTTGSPKFVRLSWRNLESNARQINTALRNTERSCAMITAPIFNGYGQSVIHTHLLAGGSFVLTRERLISREFWDIAREGQCNSIGGTPYFYQVLDRLDLDSLRVPRLTKFVQTGGRLPENLALKFHRIASRRGGTLHLMYGQAEATARITGLEPHFLPDAVRSVGQVLSGGRLTVELDGIPCGPIEEGELIYEGPNVMMGYATDPDDFQKGDSQGGRLTTGDLGYRDDRGLFYITGRKARFVKLFGWRISLDDVEEMLSHTGPVAAVTEAENEAERIVIYTEGSSAALEEPLQQLAVRLRIHHTGFEIRSVGRIPRLANGKVDYRSLRPSLALAGSQTAP
jgi:long-chain acyl-CoA synthetase